MTGKIRVALDYHGLIVDHRLAKYNFFQDQGIPYSSPRLDRDQILQELEERGVPKIEYTEGLMKLFRRADYVRQFKPIPGIRKFLIRTQQHWFFKIVSADLCDVELIRESIDRLALPRVESVKTTPDGDRREYLMGENVRLYFDDKKTHLAEIVSSGIRVVQICEPDPEKRSEDAHLVFDSWDDALRNIDRISDLVAE